MTAALRQFAGVAAVLLIATQLLGAFHFLVVSHSVCAEHGELIHVADATGAHDVELSEAPQAGQRLVADNGDEGDHNHDLCDVVERSAKDSLNEAATGVLPIPPAALAALGLSALPPPHSPIPPIALAPKQGPPNAC